jgi:hypothetical protein
MPNKFLHLDGISQNLWLLETDFWYGSCPHFQEYSNTLNVYYLNTTCISWEFLKFYLQLLPKAWSMAAIDLFHCSKPIFFGASHSTYGIYTNRIGIATHVFGETTLVVKR